MHRHGPSCLEGPFARGSFLWSTHHSPSMTIHFNTSGSPLRSEAGLGGNSIRQELVARARREIASGDCDTSEKLDAALDELFRQFHAED
jgi:hypothetical protein